MHKKNNSSSPTSHHAQHHQPVGTTQQNPLPTVDLPNLPTRNHIQWSSTITCQCSLPFFGDPLSLSTAIFGGLETCRYLLWTLSSSAPWGRQWIQMCFFWLCAENSAYIFQQDMPWLPAQENSAIYLLLNIETKNKNTDQMSILSTHLMNHLHYKMGGPTRNLLHSSPYSLPRQNTIQWIIHQQVLLQYKLTYPRPSY